MSAPEFRLVTAEQMLAAGSSTFNEDVAVAVNETGEVISMVSFNTAYRGRMCSSCTGNCATGGMVWTRSDYREQGIFRGLFEWAQAALGVDKVYIHNKSQTGVLVAQRFELAVPVIEMPPVGNLYEEEMKMTDLAIRIQDVI